MKPPDRPFEERVQMVLEAALERAGGPDREAFIRWLSAADPKLAATVIVRLAERNDRPSENGD
jgi:ABC-type branched-subunit amino acid transport system substrate-binding protein